MERKVPKIQRNIPIPSYPKGKYSLLADSMEAGDSVIIESATQANILRANLRYRGFKMAARPLGEGKYRCWKLG